VGRFSVFHSPSHKGHHSRCDTDGTIYPLGYEGVSSHCIGANPTDLTKNAIGAVFICEKINSTPMSRPETLLEYGCSAYGQQVNESFIRCQSGCSNGVCIKMDSSCTNYPESKFKGCLEIKEKEVRGSVPGFPWEDKCIGKIDCSSLEKEECANGAKRSVPPGYEEIFGRFVFGGDLI